MWYITAFRIFFLIMVGTILFGVLLHFFGFFEGRYIRKRSRNNHGNQENKKVKIVLTYLLLLIAVILLAFLMIRSKIRGEV